MLILYKQKHNSKTLGHYFFPKLRRYCDFTVTCVQMLRILFNDFFFLYVVLEVEPQAIYMLGKLATLRYISRLFCLKFITTYALLFPLGHILQEEDGKAW